jgi:prophage antirepressor-like protein
MLETIQKFSDSDVFSLTLESEPEKTRHWFRATEICELLFSRNNAHKYVTIHCKDWQYREFQVGSGRPALYICESGVYRLILRSKAPVALEFQDWLTEDVLPKLRASGGYIMPTATSAQLEVLQAEIEALKAEKAQAFAEGKQAAANLLPQPERVTNPDRHIYKVAVCCLRVLSLTTKAMDAFEVGQRMRQEALDGAFLMQPEYRDTLIQSPDPVTIDFALQCLQQVGLVDFTGRHAKLKATKAKVATAMDELLRESGKLYKPLTEHIACWQESIEHWRS